MFKKIRLNLTDFINIFPKNEINVRDRIPSSENVLLKYIIEYIKFFSKSFKYLVPFRFKVNLIINPIYKVSFNISNETSGNRYTSHLFSVHPN